MTFGHIPISPTHSNIHSLRQLSTLEYRIRMAHLEVLPPRLYWAPHLVESSVRGSSTIRYVPLHFVFLRVRLCVYVEMKILAPRPPCGIVPPLQLISELFVSLCAGLSIPMVVMSSLIHTINCSRLQIFDRPY